MNSGVPPSRFIEFFPAEFNWGWGTDSGFFGPDPSSVSQDIMRFGNQAWPT